MGNEYINAHRAYRQLAIRLADCGFPVLRFDYYGYGDSGGDECQAGILQQLADISTAIQELRKRAGLAKVCLVGLRFGATLSMMVGAERGDVEDMVLWDPVVNGRAYIEDMNGLHERALGYTYSASKRRQRMGIEMESLGFPLTASLLVDLEKIDLFGIRSKPATNVLVIGTGVDANGAGLSEHLKHTGARVEYQSLQAPSVWMSDSVGNLIVPAQVLKLAVSWISGLRS
jgi:pimeloyl-ACP methyl ester carboxylesterase